MQLNEITKNVIKVSTSYEKVNLIKRDDDWYILKLQEEIGELVSAYLSSTERGRKRGKSTAQIKENFEDELADVLGQLLVTANYFNVDIENALKRKWFKYLNR